MFIVINTYHFVVIQICIFVCILSFYCILHIHRHFTYEMSVCCWGDLPGLGVQSSLWRIFCLPQLFRKKLHLFFVYIRFYYLLRHFNKRSFSTSSVCLRFILQ